MAKYFDLDTWKPVTTQLEKPKWVGIRKKYLHLAMEMQEKFPRLALSECLNLIIKARKQLQKDRLMQKMQREYAQEINNQKAHEL
jgi:hypothetical protein